MPPLTFPSTPTVSSSASPQPLPSSPPHPESPRDSPPNSQSPLPPPPPLSSPLSSPPSIQPDSTPTPQPHQYFLPPNPRPPFPLSLTALPTPLRHKIISETSISTLLTLSTTHPTLRTDIQTSNAITDTVFNSAHNFHTSPRPPSVQKLLFADPYLHPLFAKAIAESYDGAEALSEDLTSGEYFSWLQQRCYVVHLIDRRFSEIEGDAKQKGKETKRVYCGIEGTKRKIILLQFWRLLDCIENWSVSISASLDGIQDGFKLTADDYFGWCVDFVKGFKHATLSDEEREDLSEVVGFFMEVPPVKLVKGGERKVKGEGEGEGENQDCFWRFLGMRCIVQGFCLLGGLERVVGALYGNYPLAEMRGMGKEEGMEREIARGIGKWVEWERDRAERRRWDARGSRKGMATKKRTRIDRSDDGDHCGEGQDKNSDMKEGGNGDGNEGDGHHESQDIEEKILEDIANNNPEFV